MHNATVCVKTAILNVPNLSFCMYKQVSLIYVGWEGIRTEKRLNRNGQKRVPLQLARVQTREMLLAQLIVIVSENSENKRLFVTQFVFYLVVLFVPAANKGNVTHGKTLLVSFTYFVDYCTIVALVGVMWKISISMQKDTYILIKGIHFLRGNPSTKLIFDPSILLLCIGFRKERSWIKTFYTPVDPCTE